MGIKVNMNARVRVTLTLDGLRKLQERDSATYKHDTKGFVVETQLWTLINIFGKDFIMGNTIHNGLPFENNSIEILDAAQDE